MAEHHVGLDIGTFAVRAAEVSGEPGSLTLHRFAQLTLPPGAVVDGEIMDPPAVTAAIKALWDKGGFKSNKVVVGIGNRWVKVRQAEVPALAREDVRSSLRYEAQEVIPFADEDAVVDFVVQDRFQGPEGGDFLRILVVAAQRQMVQTTLDTVRRAGLEAALVDLTPFALVRSLAPIATPGVSEAIVSIGAGLTNVVVHTGGTPRLARMTPRAGGAVTENLTRSLGVDAQRAEALKRGAAVAVADPQTAQAAELIAAELNPLVQEIQGSLDYFLAQTDDVELRRVLLTGAGSKTVGLRNRLASELRVPVEMGSPLEYLRLGKTGLSDEQLAAAAAVMAAPVGLAMAPMATPATKLTSLFPVEFHESNSNQKAKIFTIGAVAAVACVLGGLSVMKQAEVVQARSDADRAEKQAATIHRQVDKLRPFEELDAGNTARRNQINAVLARDVDVTRFLDTMTGNLPDEVGLTMFTLDMSAAPAAGAPAAPGAAPAGLGLFTVGGAGKTHDSTANWITRMRELNMLTGVWTPNSTKVTPTPTSPAGVTFGGNADIGPAARSTRADYYKAEQ